MKITNIIDCHTHFFPKEASDSPEKFACQNKEKHWLGLVSPDDKKSLQGWVNVEEMRQHMKEAGIQKSVLLGWYWEQSKTCKLQNQWYAQLKKDFSDSFEVFASLQPTSTNETVEQLKFIVDHGFKGVGEMHPQVQGFSLKDKCWTDVVEFCINHKLLINLHVTEPVGRPYEPREETLFREIQWLVETYPEMKLILAHWGGLIFMHELNPYIKKSWKNVYYDTSASPLLYENKVFQLAIETIGADKILYGSDYPLILYPSKMDEPNFATFLGIIQETLHEPKILNKVLNQNIHQLFVS